MRIVCPPARSRVRVAELLRASHLRHPARRGRRPTRGGCGRCRASGSRPTDETSGNDLNGTHASKEPHRRPSAEEQAGYTGAPTTLPGPRDQGCRSPRRPLLPERWRPRRPWSAKRPGLSASQRADTPSKGLKRAARARHRAARWRNHGHHRSRAIANRDPRIRTGANALKTPPEDAKRGA
jgi:hypothetical protein